MMRSFPPGTTVEDAIAYDEAYVQQVTKMVEGLVDQEVQMSSQRKGVRVPRDWRNASAAELVAWVDSLDGYWTPSRVAKIQEEAAFNPQTPQKEVIGPCLGFGALLASSLMRLSGGALLPEVPYWDSSILHAPSGHEAFVFHWAIKKFSSYGVADGFAAKLATVCQMWEKGTS